MWREMRSDRADSATITHTRAISVLWARSFRASDRAVGTVTPQSDRADSATRETRRTETSSTAETTYLPTSVDQIVTDAGQHQHGKQLYSTTANYTLAPPTATATASLEEGRAS